ncbi:MAG: DUF1653 domain-containing protein [Gemmataceae bacterium]|nr:DUF1653 domain-containing protein [Gemmataceae bacterium]
MAAPSSPVLQIVPGQVYLNTKKNTRYEIVCLATHSEDDTTMVVYRDVETGRNFVRPLELFAGTRQEGGVEVPRFVLEADRGQA